MACVDLARKHGALPRRAHRNVEVCNSDSEPEWVAGNFLAGAIENTEVNGPAEADRQRVHRGNDRHGPGTLGGRNRRHEKARRE